MTGDHPDPRAVDDRMLRVISEKYLMLPLYLYDHSGLALRTESFIGKAVHAEWDSGQVGWIYVSKEAALKEFGGEKMTGAIRKQAEDLMRSEVAVYDAYLRGECYGFELYKNVYSPIAAGASLVTCRRHVRIWHIISRTSAKVWWNTWKNRNILLPL